MMHTCIHEAARDTRRLVPKGHRAFLRACLLVSQTGRRDQNHQSTHHCASSTVWRPAVVEWSFPMGCCLSLADRAPDRWRELLGLPDSESGLGAASETFRDDVSIESLPPPQIRRDLRWENLMSIQYKASGAFCA
eukprot:4445898-Prymnesium_polylepis.1